MAAFRPARVGLVHVVRQAETPDTCRFTGLPTPVQSVRNGAFGQIWALVEVAQFAAAADRIHQEHVGTLVEIEMFASVPLGASDWMRERSCIRSEVSSAAPGRRA